MIGNKDKLFCEISPTCYAISLRKEILKRHLANLTNPQKLAHTFQKEKYPNIVSSHSSNMIKKGKDIDPTLQKNKAINIQLSSRQINGIIIKPGEVFSFWKLVGKITKKKGYLDGRLLHQKKLTYGLGGGLCNLANTINLLILHSPLEIIELHKHSDALAPDGGQRKPFSAGTSILYNNMDYRFKNNTNQNVQLLLWCEGDTSYGELRSEKAFPWKYKLVEENHHFTKKKDKYYRISQIYKETYDAIDGWDKSVNIPLKRELIWDNHSEVLYDYALIPENLIS